MSLRVIVGGPGRSMCSHHLQRGIYVNRNSLRHMALDVCAIVRTCCDIESNRDIISSHDTNWNCCKAMANMLMLLHV